MIRNLDDEVTRAVGSLKVCNIADLKSEVAYQVRRKTGTMPSHQQLNQAVQQAMRDGRITQDRDDNYRPSN